MHLPALESVFDLRFDHFFALTEPLEVLVVGQALLELGLRFVDNLTVSLEGPFVSLDHLVHLGGLLDFVALVFSKESAMAAHFAPTFCTHELKLF